ncbi:MAG: polysaccharide deacetylase family protein [Deltaproteobacteria bacterium]|nr:polysaccharide deacetylase family protein [Deltaproteobacteria bacterium]NND30669.1 polysaccharide deacetylase family protein [Myxococcales bacterium]MBT8463943.1 polysaccharide deacetylase family protein [Deltaproteobacteria bacterium]NNK08908.1 polysaccharide deacetylase family protein [Myxococcales bacterium]NNK42677.1 polysaccharide deacetylase family protein [Myxococcales bacterium]
MTLVRRTYHKLLLTPGLASSFRRVQGDYATILKLHRVRDDRSDIEGTDAETLRRSLAYLRRHRYELISLGELFQRMAGDGPRLRGAVAFTLDDGYRDQAEIAGPIFREFDCPLTVFLATGFVDGALWCWWDRVEYVFSNTRRESIAVPLGHSALRYHFGIGSDRYAMRIDFVERCKAVDDDEKHRAIARLAHEAEVELPEAAPSEYAPMTWTDVRANERRGMSFGPHTVSHPVLSRTTPERARWEIAESWRRLRAEVQNPLPIFCYPNGQDADFGRREVETVREIGLIGAVSAQPGFAIPASFEPCGEDRFNIKRMPFPEQISVLAQSVSGIERVKQAIRGAVGKR